MAKYQYDIGDEVFKRVDNRGNHLNVNVSEAQRIVSLMDLGYSANAIKGKVSLTHPKATNYTVGTFIKNYEAGNIEIPTDAPAPTHMLEGLTDGNRIDALEKRVTELELILEESPLDKVKKWLKS